MQNQIRNLNHFHYLSLAAAHFVKQGYSLKVAPKNMRIGADNTRINKSNVFSEFVTWSALPHAARFETGVLDQKAFSKKHGVSEDTLTRWKQRTDFQPKIDRLVKDWSQHRTPTVIHSIYKSAANGNAKSQLLWLMYFEKFDPKAKRAKGKDDVFIREEDVRFLIEMLPEPLKSEHYANLRKLLDDSVAYKDGNPDDPRWDERPEDNL